VPERDTRGRYAVAAVVVSYNAASHLASCLASLVGEGLEAVVVVDNGSTDESAAVATRAGARWVAAGQNLGYGRAANMGARAVSEPYLLICNPDLEVQPGMVDALVRRMQATPALGVVGPKILNPDRTLYPSARTFPDLVDAMGHGLLSQIARDNPFTRRYRLLDWDHAKPAEVDWVSGACFLVRREAWTAIGGFDPSYFMYMEDVDLCWRLRQHGWRVGYEPAASVIHFQGVSAGRHPYRMLMAHHRSMWCFARRTTRGAQRAALPVVAVGLAGRLVVAAARHRLDGGAYDSAAVVRPGSGSSSAPGGGSADMGGCWGSCRLLRGGGRRLVRPRGRYPIRGYGQGFIE
jgi:N-acetylglucosaminyl-diphospho-decaprenol L-rhamnosyltransferase